MKFFPRYYCLLLVLTFSVYSHSQIQANYPKTLLWRISGNGLKSPSYLFGTMHLNDKRLFRLDDSVYTAIEKTDGLAIEVNPGEIAALFMEQMIGEMENGKKISDMLDEKDLKKYGPALSRKIGKPASEITTKDILKEKNKWMAEYMEKGEMPTFLDAHLCNLARLQGKWVGGIEDISDQTNLLEGLIDRSDISDILIDHTNGSADRAIEQMIEAYTSQDINRIAAMTDLQSQEEKDVLLIKRNIKMARRMDSLSAIRNMFFAVGVAHLPGDSGVISLLQKRGFIVDPVISGKKIEIKDYKVKETRVNWTEVSGSKEQYKIDMPGNPASFKLYGLIDCKLYFDIFNLSCYLTMGVPSSLSVGNKDTLFNTLAKSIFTNIQTSYTSKKIVKDGMEGREFAGGKAGARIRIQVFAEGKLITVNMAVAFKKDQLQSADVDKFFNSFAVNHPQPEKAVYHAFEDSIMGIRIVSPAMLEYSKSLGGKSRDDWKITGYAGTENTTGAYVLLFSKEVKPRYYITSDSSINNDLLRNLREAYTNISTDVQNINGLEITHYRGKYTVQPGLYLHATSYIKNNRNIVIMVMCDSLSLTIPLLDTIFRSFSAISPSIAKWSQQSPANHLFTTYAPAVFYEYKSGNLSGGYQFVAYDTTTATSFLVIPDTLNKYTWYNSLPEYWKKLKETDLGEQDSILSETITKNGPLEVMDIQLAGNSNRIKRLRFVLNGNVLYRMEASAGKNYILSENVNRFFNDFQLMITDSSHWVTQSKAAIIMNDLSSTDSVVRLNAYNALTDAPFNQEEQEQLLSHFLDTLKSPYSNSPSAYINIAIGRKIADKDSDKMVATIRQHFPLLKEKEQLKGACISLLSEIQTSSSYKALIDLLHFAPPAKPLEFEFAYNLSDSLELTKQIFNQLVSFAKDTLLGPSIAHVCITLQDSGMLKKEELAPWQQDFISMTAKLAPPYRKQNDHFDSNIYSLVKLLGRYQTPSSLAALRKLLPSQPIYLKKTVALELIKQKQPVDSITMVNIASDKNIRIEFYKELKEIKKQSLFPAIYATQTKFAEALMYENCSKEDLEADQIKFIAKKTAIHKGNTYSFYIYKVVLGTGDDKEEYLGISGGYKLNSNALFPEEDLSGIYWDEQVSTSNSVDLLKAYLKSIEDRSEQKEE